MAEKLRVGIVGCGAISANYLQNARHLPVLEIAACADLDLERARARAKEFGVPKAVSVDALMADPGVDLVLNLTIPKAHAPLSLRAFQHGKHTYTEKPFAVDREEGRQVLDAARKSGLRVGCAPDTVLGAGIQTARKVLDDGTIGRPVSFAAQMLGRGPEGFHPDPAFFYQPGGGPMFDMGPYYLTALLNLLGPVRRLTSLASIAIPERVVAKGPRQGDKLHVDTPDHLCGVLEFENGAVGTLTTSFAVCHGDYSRQYPILIYGTEGALRVPDPNTFDGQVQVRRTDDKEWQDVPLAFPTGYGRSVGVADMAVAIRSGRPHRCSGEQGFAALDLMQGFLDSSQQGQAVTPVIRYQRPAPMPTGLPLGTLDE